MSKMSQLHAELSEQAAELGFRSIEEAEASGYHVTYVGNKVKLAFDMSKACELAHEDLIEEREKLIELLTIHRDDAADLAMGKGMYTDEWARTANVLDKAITFIKENVK